MGIFSLNLARKLPRFFLPFSISYQGLNFTPVNSGGAVDDGELFKTLVLMIYQRTCIKISDISNTGNNQRIKNSGCSKLLQAVSAEQKYRSLRNLVS